MVRLEEVEDEAFLNEKTFEEDDADYTDTDSEISDASDLEYPSEETLSDRILALRDIIPPTTRRRLHDTYTSISTYGKSGLWLAAKGAYAISVSALFISVPFVYLLVEDMQLGEQEKEMRMREMGNEILTPGATSSTATEGDIAGAKAAL